MSEFTEISGSKLKSCVGKKCLVLSGHFVFSVSTEIRTRGGRERGKMEASRWKEADHLTDEDTIC